MRNSSALISAFVAAILLPTFLNVAGQSDASLQTAENPTLAERLCSVYESVDTVSCEVRKTTTVAGTTARMLSRVMYARNDRIHVENFSPVRRRIIADGEALYYYEEGKNSGYVCPIRKLDKTRLLMLKNVPGTPLEHLVQLKGLPEDQIAPQPEFSERKGYQSEKVYVAISCDSEGRLARIEFYSASDMKEMTAQYDFSAFQKAAENVWIPCLHKAEIFLPNGGKITETRRISNLTVNEPIADRMFDPGVFFKDVDFAEDTGGGGPNDPKKDDNTD